MPPIGSNSIFSMALGPRHDRIMSATLQPFNIRFPHCFRFWLAYVFAAVIFDSCALRPTCLSPACVSTRNQSGLSLLAAIIGGFTHNHHWSLHLESIVNLILKYSIGSTDTAILSFLKSMVKCSLSNPEMHKSHSAFPRLSAHTLN